MIAGHRGEALALGEFPVDPAMALRPDAPLTVEQQASGRAIEQYRAESRCSDTTPPSAENARSRAGRIAAVAIAAAVALVDPEAVIRGGVIGAGLAAYQVSR